MTIASICVGDTVVVQTGTPTRGAAGGVSYAYTDGSTIDCRVDTPGGSESTKYEAREARYTHCVMFASNPGIHDPANQTTKYRLKWTKTQGNSRTFSSPKYLQVLDAYEENNPSGDLQLWIVDCEEEIGEKDS